MWYCLLGSTGAVILTTTSELTIAIRLVPGTWFGRGLTREEAEREAKRVYAEGRRYA